MKKIIRKLFAAKPPPNPMKQRVIPWFAAKGDKTLRLDYDLNENSIVFDLGGYHGCWTADIYCKYGCFVHVFEPSLEFASLISNKFSHNKRISVHKCGLSNANTSVNLSREDDRSSIYEQGSSKDEGKVEEIVLVDAAEFFRENNITHIDLMKINIEGGEYDLLDHLIENGLHLKIRNIQVQFHDFVPDAENRMKAIQEKLGKSHSTTYQYEFVWENWRLKDDIASDKGTPHQELLIRTRTSLPHATCYRTGGA
jgi:FkbM family methyltransferase